MDFSGGSRYKPHDVRQAVEPHPFRAQQNDPRPQAVARRRRARTHAAVEFRFLPGFIHTEFAGADAVDLWLAFDNFLDLMNNRMRSVAKALDYPYPDQLERDVRAYLNTVRKL